MIFEVFFK